MDRDWIHQRTKCTRIIKDEEDAYIRRHCLAKVQFGTEQEAEYEAMRLTMKYNQKSVFKHYHCECCDRYHTGRRDFYKNNA